MSSSSGRKKEPWRNQERHYCAICNVWMGSDRQSILLHENGKKHKEKVEASLQQRRKEKLQQEKNAQLLQQSLQQMNEAAAQQSQAHDVGFFGHAATTAAPIPSLYPSAPTAVPSYPIPPPPPPPPPSQQPKVSAKKEKNEWEARKKHRQEEKQRKREANDDDEDNSPPTSVKRPKPQIAPDQGHYTCNMTTYLEGPTFGDLLEPDMPIQLWTGATTASLAEKRLLERHGYWKDGIVAAVRPRSSANLNERLVVDVAYLKSPDDTDETLEKSVVLDRIRIRLGGDETIPDTLEEARLLAMGGEEIVTDQGEQVVDEATGLSSWSTVQIKRTTVRQELKDERARLRQQRKEAAQRAAKIQKEAEARKMEEAKVANADDSALGAYDVWSRGNTDGYKGVDIHGTAQVEVHELGKKLAEGKGPVGFKKGKVKKKKQNRRRTSADDDD